MINLALIYLKYDRLLVNETTVSAPIQAADTIKNLCFEPSDYHLKTGMAEGLSGVALISSSKSGVTLATRPYPFCHP